MTKDRTIAERGLKHRTARTAVGWKKVAVWVPSEEDAEAVRQFAAERRAKAEAIEDTLKEISTVKPETAKRIADAIAKYGSRAYTNAPGAIIELMSELTEEDDLPSVSAAYCILARAKPMSADLVASWLPGQVSNFVIRHRGVSAGKMITWAHDNPEWPTTVKDAVRDPARFATVVNTMAEDIKRTH